MIVVTRVADIIVTLAMLFVWAGVALAVLEVPGGGAPPGTRTSSRSTRSSTHWLPAGARDPVRRRTRCSGSPIRRSRAGLALYAIGSNRNAAYLARRQRPGDARLRLRASRERSRALGGLALTAASGLGDPHAGDIYTLNSVAAVVLGGVSLLGGVGGLIGPIARRVRAHAREDDPDHQGRRPELRPGDPGRADRARRDDRRPRVRQKGKTADEPRRRRAGEAAMSSGGSSVRQPGGRPDARLRRAVRRDRHRQPRAGRRARS